MNRIIASACVLMFVSINAWAQETNSCLECHAKETPGIVLDWETSVHSGEGVSCDDCHGDGHSSKDDVANVLTVTAATCGDCHDDQLTQFSKGKHSLAWAAYKAMPTTHALPLAMSAGMKG